MIAREETIVHASWLVVESPSMTTRCCTIEFALALRGGKSSGNWQERFRLRTYDADEFLQWAKNAGGLLPRGIFEPRDPYLFEIPPEKAAGRFLVVFQR